jgi:uncharacterized protein YbjT (DUF2867 family)
MMIVIAGATGNTGSVIADNLLALKSKVRVVGRDAKRLERFIQKGAEAFVADATDAGALEKAFTGAKAVYAMIPQNIGAPDVRGYQEKVSDALASAILGSGTSHVLMLSSLGADKSDKVGPVAGLHNLEEKLKGIAGLNVLFLRAGYFMENLLPQAAIIQSFGILAGPVRGDLPLPLIATRDIGAYAAKALGDLDFSGKQTRELLGAREVTYNEAAKIIGAAIGKPSLVYNQLPATLLKPALTQMGMSPNMADLLLEMAGALNTGYMKPLEPRTSANTTATTLETFVADSFVPAYRAKAAGA